jgi:tRNA(fMet)-specific endonuclease VapC
MISVSHMLDTNTVSFVFKGRGMVAQRLFSFKPSTICISAITVAELRYGAEKRQSQKLHSLIDRFIAPFSVAPFGQAEAARYGELYAALERKGTPIGELDTQIAAHALALGVTLVTNNERHFRQVEGLQLEDWL